MQGAGKRHRAQARSVRCRQEARAQAGGKGTSGRRRVQTRSAWCRREVGGGGGRRESQVAGE